MPGQPHDCARPLFTLDGPAEPRHRQVPGRQVGRVSVRPSSGPPMKCQVWVNCGESLGGTAAGFLSGTGLSHILLTAATIADRIDA